MKFLLFTLLLAAGGLYGLDAEAIKKIAGEPHSRDALMDELKLFPDAREYEVTVRTGTTTEDIEARPKATATEKTVRGRYIVSQITIPGVEEPLIMVVTYDKKVDVFKKWVLLPNGMVGESIGVADMEKRSIAWISNGADGGPPVVVVSIETHSDDKSLWKETTLQDGKVIAILQGEAVKTK